MITVVIRQYSRQGLDVVQARGLPQASNGPSQNDNMSAAIIVLSSEQTLKRIPGASNSNSNRLAAIPALSSARNLKLIPRTSALVLVITVSSLISLEVL